MVKERLILGYLLLVFSGYPLVIKHGREKSPVNGGLLMRKSSLNGGLTRQAMFDYQMVCIYIYTHIIIYNCIIHILYNDYNDSPSKFGISCFLFRQTQLKIYGFSMGAIFCESMKKLSAV